MSKSNFLTLDTNEKIQHIIESTKKSLMDEGKLNPSFFIFDERSKMHVIQIEDDFLLREGRKSIMTQLIREKIKEMKQELNLQIDKILVLQEGFYSKEHEDKKNMNLDKDFNKQNANEALIATVEDPFNFEIKVFDIIKIVDEGKTFSVLSGDPIDTFEFCKIDPEYDVKTPYINLV